MPVHIGIKVWSQNTVYIPHLQKLSKGGHCDFVEIYVGVKAEQEEGRRWRNLDIPVRLHAPHSYGGFNPADNQGIEFKQQALQRLEEFRQLLEPASIIFHPGTEGPLQESIRQYKLFKQQFPEMFKAAFIENKPSIGPKQETCRGDSVEEIQPLMQAIGFGFCLDFGHAACRAAWAKKSWHQVIEDFMRLRPQLFHISDGDIRSPIDKHRHLGAGSFPLKQMLDFLPQDAFLTLETPHDHEDNLDDFPKEADFIRNLLK